MKNEVMSMSVDEIQAMLESLWKQEGLMRGVLKNKTDVNSIFDPIQLMMLDGLHDRELGVMGWTDSDPQYMIEFVLSENAEIYRRYLASQYDDAMDAMEEVEMGTDDPKSVCELLRYQRVLSSLSGNLCVLQTLKKGEPLE